MATTKRVFFLNNDTSSKSFYQVEELYCFANYTLSSFTTNLRFIVVARMYEQNQNVQKVDKNIHSFAVKPKEKNSVLSRNTQIIKNLIYAECNIRLVSGLVNSFEENPFFFFGLTSKDLTMKDRYMLPIPSIN